MATTGKLLLVRHGESEGNRDRRFSLTSDIALTPLGVRQARAIGERIARDFRPTRIVASPYRRARDTAAEIAAAIGHAAEIMLERDLHERSIGALAGSDYGSQRTDPDYDPERFWEWRPEGGESLEDVRLRAGAVIDRLITTFPQEEIVVVSHGGVMLALCAHIEGGWTRTSVARNCELLVVEHAGRRPDAIATTVWCEVSDEPESGSSPPGGATG